MTNTTTSTLRPQDGLYGSVVAGPPSRPEPAHADASSDRMPEAELRALFKTPEAYEQAHALGMPTAAYQTIDPFGRRTVYWSRTAVSKWLDVVRDVASGLDLKRK